MKALATRPDAAVIESVIIHGDLSKLNPEQRVSYYNSLCHSLGLNALTKPFEYMRLNGKEILYAKRDAADQLRKVHAVSIKIVSREVIGDVYVVTAQATMPDGRCDESTGAVAITNLKGEAMANAYLKCETKAKRRVTLSICGLGILDETEIASVRAEQQDAKTKAFEQKIELSAPPEIEIAFDEEPMFDDTLPPISEEPNLENYVIKAGKNVGKKLKEIRRVDLTNFLKFYDGLVAKGEDIHPNVVEYATNAKDYLAIMDMAER